MVKILCRKFLLDLLGRLRFKMIRLNVCFVMIGWVVFRVEVVMMLGDINVWFNILVR